MDFAFSSDYPSSQVFTENSILNILVLTGDTTVL